MKKLTALLLAVLCLLSFAGFTTAEQTPEVVTRVTEDAKYHSAKAMLTIEEFEAAGFRLGDSCDIEFSGGCAFSDVPYFNGYYVKAGAPVIVAYPGFTYIDIALSSAELWNEANLQEGETVKITLREAGKYAAVHETLGQEYSVEPGDYENTVSFCNFRALSGGSIKKGKFFRGASPVDNSRGRAAYTDTLLKEYGIGFILDLADTKEDIQGYFDGADFASPYAFSLYAGGKTALCGLGVSYTAPDYREKTAAGLKAMLNARGPVYIHCMEGKDRTGFVCLLLETLAGAGYEELRADYMKTYENYYGVTAAGTPEKYTAIEELYFIPFLAYLHGTEDIAELKTASYAEDAANYLISGGMTKEETELLKAFLTE